MRRVPIIGSSKSHLARRDHPGHGKNLNNIAATSVGIRVSAGTYWYRHRGEACTGIPDVGYSRRESNRAFRIFSETAFGVDHSRSTRSQRASGPCIRGHPQKSVTLLLSTLKTHAPNLFFTIEDVRKVDAGFFPKTIPIPESESAPDKAATDTGNPSAESDLIADATGSPQS